MKKFLLLIITIHYLGAIEIIDSDIEQKRYYYSFCQDEPCDITDIVLDQKGLSKTIKNYLINNKRRFVSFCYPSDGLMIKSILSYVDTSKAKPLILLLRGGSRLHAIPFFNPQSHYLDYLLHTDATIVLASYRDGLSPGIDEYGGKDLVDVENLVYYLKKILPSTIDWSKAYLIGLSRGSMQMFLALANSTRLQDTITKVVSNCGILDIAQYASDNSDVAQKWKDHFSFNSQNWLDQRNCTLFIHKIRNDLPILILQGTKDDKIPINHSRSFVSSLHNLHFHNVTYLEIEGGNHALKNNDEHISLIINWLNK